MDRRELLRGLGALGLLGALAGCAPSYPVPGLKIATATRSGTYFKLGTALAGAWNDELGPGTATEVLPTAGSVENFALLARRGADVAISQLDVASAQFALTAATDPSSLRALARIYDDVVHLVVPQESPIRSLTQLRGHTVSVGELRSGVFYTAQRLLSAVGLPLTAITAVNDGIENSVQALQARRIDAFFWLGALTSDTISALASTMSIRLVDMSDIQEPVQRASTFYAPRQIPAGTYGDDNKPLRTLYVRNVLVVRAEMADALAHDLVKAMFDQQPRIAQAARAALTIDTRRGIGTEPVLLHPGAEQWFREAREGG